MKDPNYSTPPTLIAEVGFPALSTSYPGPSWGTIEKWNQFFVIDPLTGETKREVGLDRNADLDLVVNSAIPHPEHTPCTVRAPGSRLRVARPNGSDLLGTWYITDLVAPREEYLIIDRVEHTSKLNEYGRGVWQILFVLGERRVSRFYAIPPRQSYGVEIDFWSNANPGLVLFYGWRVHFNDYRN